MIDRCLEHSTKVLGVWSNGKVVADDSLVFKLDGIGERSRAVARNCSMVVELRKRSVDWMPTAPSRYGDRTDGEITPHRSGCDQLRRPRSDRPAGSDLRMCCQEGRMSEVLAWKLNSVELVSKMA